MSIISRIVFVALWATGSGQIHGSMLAALPLTESPRARLDDRTEPSSL